MTEEAWHWQARKINWLGFPVSKGTRYIMCHTGSARSIPDISIADQI